MTYVDPNIMTPQERLDELYEILAAGIQRMREKKSKTENIQLDKLSKTSVHVVNKPSKRRMT
jgi:hypothetical protein